MPRDYSYYSPTDAWVSAADKIGQGFQTGMGMGVENAMLRKNKKDDFLSTAKLSGFQVKDPNKKYSQYATEIQAPTGEILVKDENAGELADKDMARQERQAKIDYQKAQAKALENGTPFYTFDPTTGAISQAGSIPKGARVQSTLPGQIYTDKKTEAENLKQVKTDQLLNATRDTLSTLQNVKKGIKYFGATGLIPSLPGTAGRTWDADFNKLKSTMILNVINSMKSASRTGATGFGALNEQELKVLTNAATALEKGLPEQDAAIKLAEIEVQLNKILSGAIPQEDIGQQGLSFNSEQEIEAANLPDGTEIIFQGKPMRVRY